MGNCFVSYLAACSQRDLVGVVIAQLNSYGERHGTALVSRSAISPLRSTSRLQPRWTFTEVRRAALALAREVERRVPVATTVWWKEQRHGVFVDYNQNARDRTIASAYSVRPVPDARVSCPLAWEEVADVEPADLRLDTVPDRFASLGDPGAGIDDAAGDIEPLLDLADRDESEGLGEAPWPPHFPKGRAPSRRASSPHVDGRSNGRAPAEIVWSLLGRSPCGLRSRRADEFL